MVVLVPMRDLKAHDVLVERRHLGDPLRDHEDGAGAHGVVGVPHDHGLVALAVNGRRAPIPFLAVSARIIEIELRVADVERSRRFYHDLIGVPVGELETHGADGDPHAHATWGQWAGASPSLLMLNLYPAGTAEATRSRLGFVVEELDVVHERLRSAGVTVIQPPESRPWGRAATYRDPDGNTVSLTEAPR